MGDPGALIGVTIFKNLTEGQFRGRFQFSTSFMAHKKSLSNSVPIPSSNSRSQELGRVSHLSSKLVDTSKILRHTVGAFQDDIGSRHIINEPFCEQLHLLVFGERLWWRIANDASRMQM